MPEIPKSGPMAAGQPGAMSNAASAVAEGQHPGAGGGATNLMQAGSSCPTPEEGVPVAADGSGGLKVELEPSDVNYNPPLI